MEILKNIIEIIGKLLLTIVIILLLIVIISIAVYFMVGDFKKSLPFIQPVCFIAAVVIMYTWFERKNRLHLGWLQDNKWQSWLAGSVSGMTMMTITFLTIWLFGGVKIVGVSFDYNIIQRSIYWIIFFLFVAINEELLCRGYLQGLIRRYFGVATGIIVTSAFFASLHLMNPNVLKSPIPLINLFLAGIMFGIIREVAGGLWLPIGVHFTWNLFQGSLFGSLVSGMSTGESIIHTKVIGNDLISGGGFGVEGSLVTSMLLILFTIMIWIWYRSKVMKRKKLTDRSDMFV